MFWLMWVTYASFYLLRVNISVAVPEIMETFGLSRAEMGLVMSSQFLLYAIGQFINGQIGDRIDARRFVAAGLLASAALNVLFGFSAGALTLMVVLWGLNGYFQSMGWGPTVKTMANWFPVSRRNLIAGRLATAYVLGGAIAWLVAGALIAHWSWRHVFWWPALLTAGLALHWFIRARSAPEVVGLPSVEEQEFGDVSSGGESPPGGGYLGLRPTLRLTLANPQVWVAAWGLFGLNIVRYGFMDWAPTFFVETHGESSSLAALHSIAFPLAGAAGAVGAGWACQRLGSRSQAQVGVVLLLALAVTCWAFPRLSAFGAGASFATLLVLGFLTFGPHMLLVTALPPVLGSRQAASSVTGFIDAVGYAGAALTGGVSGLLVDTLSWTAAFYFWISGALLAAFMMSLLRRVEPGGKRLPVS
jgi:OPA family glycerol-3-phosphate transporter-like MFS transporter